jgi:hypothetical protein
MLIGFTRATVTVVVLLTLTASAYALWRPSRLPKHDDGVTMP